MSRLQRMLNAKSIAVVGGGWASNVIEQLLRSNYGGDIWPVHPTKETVNGLAAYASLDSLPKVPDLAFLGINRLQTIEMVEQLSASGAGGAVCFASGYAESESHAEFSGGDLQSRLLNAAGDMPILGPNCYGFLNYTNDLTVWPDQHGGVATERGVAIIAQSSNIAINMTMQRRGVPVSFVFTCGNQAQIGVSELVEEMSSNEDVTAIGLYLEGIDNLEHFARACQRAREKGKLVVVIKTGKSIQSQQASLTHTASLTGSAVANTALFERLGVAEVDDIETFMEALKVAHHIGPLANKEIVSVSCSGGEASMMADMANDLDLHFPELNESQKTKLNQVLGDQVGLANPLDYHTYIWGDVEKMSTTFAAATQGTHALSVFVLDLPRADTCDPTGHECAIQAAINAKKETNANIAILASMAENLSEVDSQRLLQAGVLPLHGMRSGLLAIEACAKVGQAAHDLGLLVSKADVDAEYETLSESSAKQVLESYGVSVPGSVLVSEAERDHARLSELKFPVVAKAMGIAHKTESQAVVLNINSAEELETEIARLSSIGESVLIEEMVLDNIVELLVGVTVDPTGIVLLTLGAGGIYTELHRDSVSIVLPCTNQDIERALSQLRCSPLLHGYRNKPGVQIELLIDTIQAVADYAQDNVDRLYELDINPLIAGEKQCIAVDALIRQRTIS